MIATRLVRAGSSSERLGFKCHWTGSALTMKDILQSKIMSRIFLPANSDTMTGAAASTVVEKAFQEYRLTARVRLVAIDHNQTISGPWHAVPISWQ